VNLCYFKSSFRSSRTGAGGSSSSSSQFRNSTSWSSSSSSSSSSFGRFGNVSLLKSYKTISSFIFSQFFFKNPPPQPGGPVLAEYDEYDDGPVPNRGWNSTQQDYFETYLSLVPILKKYCNYILMSIYNFTMLPVKTDELKIDISEPCLFIFIS